MKIRVLSDLHLECNEPDAIPYAPADLVVLAGDIHNHAEGLRWAAETFDPDVPVVYVPGNHEYYDGEFGALEAAMRDAAATLDHVHYLNNAAYADPAGRFRVLGTTLWSDFELFGGDAETRAQSIAECERVMLDFKGLIQVDWPGDGEAADEIATAEKAAGTNGHAEKAPGPAANSAPSPRSFAPRDALALHRTARAWLERELAKPWAGATIIVTHHAPHRASLAARYADDLASAGFISDLSALVRPPVALWIHGHTHTSFDYTTAEGTRVVCNPHGYIRRRTGERENPSFEWDKVVTLA
ncbi:metallophosphoesterase [Burkholderia oklahomensis]|uniref:metallophosphoesterase n=1 Tax=Burkholderia oklahomensis TaxID=342113 RepID=UPI00016A7894|nr:metallophosphoesterase [Burkholderia oklahomensis]AJX31727.1 calcineurin-like phosphoesterase family protein [Burkholderia oklahomensis C6786]AOI46207.1 serine/threonine protein phosphatase [Burkholderia oklahomensis C6786]KUY64113.1 serine/threonine protein phosphatase [Burkholderia oklahomensis C6786]MBI0361216.1 metallophosphoesterase family protein [Burkholderia oklahomensis]SUW54963.1 putative phosphoesterase [Burkholderia oklahomensis]